MNKRTGRQLGKEIMYLGKEPGDTFNSVASKSAKIFYLFHVKINQIGPLKPTISL